MTVVTLIDYQPGPRYDGQPWTKARIEEASASTGPWTAIDEVVLDPVDTNPSLPRTRNFTTDNATLDHGWYRVVFIDADGSEQLTAPVAFDAAVTWIPTVQDIADLSPVYTRGAIEQDGQELGTFDAGTDPTASQVQALIGVAVREVAGRVGLGVGALNVHPELARQTVAWHVAASIEAEKHPEGASDVEGAYRWKQASYVACLNELVVQARNRPLRLV
jgi:hypothetical protein